MNEPIDLSDGSFNAKALDRITQLKGEISMLRESRAALADQEQLSRLEANRLRGELSACRHAHAYLQDALLAVEKSSGFVPGDTSLSEWVAGLVAGKNEANAACAEMRDGIEALAFISYSHPHLWNEKAARAYKASSLSNCGTAILENVKRLRDELAKCRDFFETRNPTICASIKRTLAETEDKP